MVGDREAPRLYTLAEVAERLHKSKRWMQEYLRHGRMAGRTRRFTDADIIAIIEGLPCPSKSFGGTARQTGAYADPSEASLWTRAQKLTAKNKRTPSGRSANGRPRVKHEPLRVAEVAAILRVTPRAVQGMALRGDLPGAAQIGRSWTFDGQKLRRFIAEREAAATCQRETSIDAVASGGSERLSTASSIEKAYAAAMSRALGRRVKAKS